MYSFELVHFHVVVVFQQNPSTRTASFKAKNLLSEEANSFH